MANATTSTGRFEHYRSHRPRPLSRTDAGRVTLLYGGATRKHERLIQGALEHLGYRSRPLPQITKADLLAGRDFIDAGACCPTAFTAGNLVNFLRDRVRDIGAERTVREYAFITAGGCGPCRFGQYHESYALALEGMGLPDFSVYLLDLRGLESDVSGLGRFEVTLPFILGVTSAFMCGDILTELEYMIRPYERVAGQMDQVVAECAEHLYHAFLERPRTGGKYTTLAWYLCTGHYQRAMHEVWRKLGTVRLDRLRVKPKVKITGEFWLQAHEGEGNYDIKRWLEAEGAEVKPPVYTAWFDYLIHCHRERRRERFGAVRHARMAWLLTAGLQRLLRLAYDGLRHAANDLPGEMPDQVELQGLAEPYYRHRLDGGEGYSLIGKALDSYRNRRAHMVCELSPYGCMPNTMSVGAMSRVLHDYPDLLYAPLEIKGDAEVHALSRCQMILAEAHKRARLEFDQALRASGLTLQKIRDYEARVPSITLASTHIPHHGFAGSAANYVTEVAARLERG